MIVVLRRVVVPFLLPLTLLVLAVAKGLMGMG
jgi:hypothetical protein